MTKFGAEDIEITTSLTSSIATSGVILSEINVCTSLQVDVVS